jgi:hypothetical protein
MNIVSMGGKNLFHIRQKRGALLSAYHTKRALSDQVIYSPGTVRLSAAVNITLYGAFSNMHYW